MSATLAATVLGFEDGTSAGFHSTGNARVRVVAGGHGSDHALELGDRAFVSSDAEGAVIP